MKEQLYTIPVNDAFDADCECPLCYMYRDLEQNAIDYTMGSSYMQDDIREQTDKVGFCSEHIRQMYDVPNRLGLALMLNTHFNKIIKDMKKAAAKGAGSGKGIFSKKDTGLPAIVRYIRDLEGSCFVCDRINMTYPRYIDTVFYLWKNDSDFRSRLKNSKGFCLSHYAELYEEALKRLTVSDKNDFIETLDTVFFENIDRVNEDVAWFIEKFDYRNKDKPWKNSKDALPRGVLKADHIFVGDEE
mgnify:CR=1 FL=1